MKTSIHVALALASGLLVACQGRSASRMPVEQRAALGNAGHAAVVPVAPTHCGAGDDSEGPYAEEEDLVSICNQRPLGSCQTADGLCHVIEALPLDIARRCSGASRPAACVPSLVQDDDNATVCRNDSHGNAWALRSEIPTDWQPLAANAPQEWQVGCDGIPHCQD